MQTQHRLRRCFSPALSAYFRPPMKLCRSGPAVIIEPAVVAVAAMRQFPWWSVA